MTEAQGITREERERSVARLNEAMEYVNHPYKKITHQDVSNVLTALSSAEDLLERAFKELHCIGRIENLEDITAFADEIAAFLSKSEGGEQ